jgi:hypothetical protein
MHEFNGRVLNKLVDRQYFKFFEQLGRMGSQGDITDDAYGLFLLFLNLLQISGVCTTININAKRDIREEHQVVSKGMVYQ